MQSVAVMSDTEPPAQDDTPDLIDDNVSANENGSDLFGDDDGDEELPVTARRTLDDENLDSGDDLERDDRLADTVEDEYDPNARSAHLIDCDVPRVHYPEGQEFYLVNLPPFIGIRQENYSEATYEPPVLPHDGDEKRETSQYSTAMSTLHWRHDPADQQKLQSTARYVRWSDGSLTLQLATKPTEHYKISVSGLRSNFPPNPRRPAPTTFDPAKDQSLTFLSHFIPQDHIEGGLPLDIQLMQSIDATMKIMPSSNESSNSAALLQATLLKAKSEAHDPLARFKEIKEDPELARRAAEQFEKDRARAIRKRENAEDRLVTRRNNVLGRVGLGARTGGGLSVAGLEDEMGMPVSRGKKKSGNRRKTNRYGEIYSDDEDDTLPRRHTREDEYDREDDFLADSDEEPEEYGGDDDLLDDEEEVDADDDDNDNDEDRNTRQPRKRQDTPKRNRDEDLDAEGEPDDEILLQQQQQQQQSPRARKKARVIVDDDEEGDM